MTTEHVNIRPVAAEHAVHVIDAMMNGKKALSFEEHMALHTHLVECGIIGPRDCDFMMGGKLFAFDCDADGQDFLYCCG